MSKTAVAFRRRSESVSTTSGRPVPRPGQALIEAVLVERGSIDGDIPEFRTSPLPEGATPAVPVITESLSSLYVGAMLQQASTQVRRQLEAAAQLHARQLDEHIQAQLAANEDAVPADIVAAAQESFPPAPVGVEGYGPGRPPTPIEVCVDPTQLPSLPSAEKARLAALPLTTTQGRRSMVPGIERFLTRYLEKQGHQVLVEAPVRTLFVREWMLVLDSATISPRFDAAAVAASSFAAAMSKVGFPDRAQLRLKVSPEANYSARRWGWSVVVGL